MELNFFALRHKATQQYMPEFESGRGYSHWSPVGVVEGGIATVGGDGALAGSVRLFPTMQGANNARVAWARGIHERHFTGPDISSLDPGGDDYVKVRDAGRTKDDLEIVPMLLTPSERAVLHIKFNQQDCVNMMRKAFEQTLAEYQQVMQNADRFKALEEMSGAWQDGSMETVKITQDDATRQWLVSVGDSSVRTYDGGTLGAAVDKASKFEVQG